MSSTFFLESCTHKLLEVRGVDVSEGVLDRRVQAIALMAVTNGLMAAVAGHQDESKGLGGFAGDVLGNIISGD